MIWKQTRYFCQRNAKAKCRGCEPVAIKAGRVLMSDKYWLEAILLIRINTDITSQKEQNSSRHNTISEIRKENVCQHTERTWLATIWQKILHQNDPKIQMIQLHQVVCVKLPFQGPLVLHHFRKAYVSFHLLLLFTLYNLIVNANAGNSVMQNFIQS